MPIGVTADLLSADEMIQNTGGEKRTKIKALWDPHWKVEGGASARDIEGAFRQRGEPGEGKVMENQGEDKIL